MNTQRNTRIFKTLSFLIVLMLVIGQVGTALAQAGSPPLTEEVQIEAKGKTYTVMVLKGYDVNEFGGNDSACTRTELESIHIGEVVSSPNESCLTVVEWSLKQGEKTIVTGVYPLEPGEWFYVPLAVSGVNDQVRVVGTMWYLPKGWNAHMYAAQLSVDRDARDKTTSYVGLSPTDPWILAQIDELSGRVVQPTAPIEPTATVEAPAPAEEPEVEELAEVPAEQPDVKDAMIDDLQKRMNTMMWISISLAVLIVGLALWAILRSRKPAKTTDEVVPPAS